MNAFAWIRNLKMIYCDLPADLTTLRVPISNGPFAHGHQEIQITFDLAIGISIESDVTQKSSVVTEIMRKG
jgi:hypothetical protein